MYMRKCGCVPASARGGMNVSLGEGGLSLGNESLSSPHFDYNFK